MRKTSGKKKLHLMRTLKPYLFIAPALVGILIFTIYPMIRMVTWSFYSVNQLSPEKTKFVGMANYISIFSSNAFMKAFRNTGVYAFWTVLFIMVISVLCALWLGKNTSKMSKFAQTVMFLPHIIAMISIGLIFAQMMSVDNGILNEILVAFGFERSKWTSSSSTALMSVIIVAVWKSIGYYTIIIAGSLQSISDSIYEAASLDNANKFVTMKKITLPMISPQLFFTLIIMTINSFKVFDTVRIMTDGGPNNASVTLVYYVYQEVIKRNSIGTAAAGGTVLLVMVGVLTILYFGLLSKKVHYQ